MRSTKVLRDRLRSHEDNGSHRKMKVPFGMAKSTGGCLRSHIGCWVPQDEG